MLKYNGYTMSFMEMQEEYECALYQRILLKIDMIGDKVQQEHALDDPS